MKTFAALVALVCVFVFAMLGEQNGLWYFGMWVALAACLIFAWLSSREPTP